LILELDSSLIGPGAKPGTVPDDLEQATGIERAELLAKLEGKELFDVGPLMITSFGTKKNPVMVKSVDSIRHVGCSGISYYSLRNFQFKYYNCERSAKNIIFIR